MEEECSILIVKKMQIKTVLGFQQKSAEKQIPTNTGKDVGKEGLYSC